MKSEVKKNLLIFSKIGLPYTLGGALIIFAGIYLLKWLFPESEHLTAIIFIWLALFWFVYQPLFRKKIMTAKNQMRK